MCFYFPDNFPSEAVILELKSKHLSPKLLDGLRKVCDIEAAKHKGQEQVSHSNHNVTLSNVVIVTSVINSQKSTVEPPSLQL